MKTEYNDGVVDYSIYFKSDENCYTLIFNTENRWVPFVYEPKNNRIIIVSGHYPIPKFLPSNKFKDFVVQEKDQICIHYISEKLLNTPEVIISVDGYKGYTVTKFSDFVYELKFNTKFEKYHMFNNETYLLGKDLDDEYSFDECVRVGEFLPREMCFIEHHNHNDDELKFTFIDFDVLTERK